MRNGAYIVFGVMLIALVWIFFAQRKNQNQKIQNLKSAIEKLEFQIDVAEAEAASWAEEAARYKLMDTVFITEYKTVIKTVYEKDNYYRTLNSDSTLRAFTVGLDSIE